MYIYVNSDNDFERYLMVIVFNDALFKRQTVAVQCIARVNSTVKDVEKIFDCVMCYLH